MTFSVAVWKCINFDIRTYGFFYVGALVHTRAEGGKKAYIFIDLHQWPSTSNMTIAILLHVIAQQERLSQVWRDS